MAHNNKLLIMHAFWLAQADRLKDSLVLIPLDLTPKMQNRIVLLFGAKIYFELKNPMTIEIT